MNPNLKKRIIAQQTLIDKLDKCVAKIAASSGASGVIFIQGVAGRPDLLKIRTLAAAKEGENPPVISQTPETGGVVC